MQLVVVPRNMTVLTGDPYSIECVGVQNAYQETKTTFHADGIENTVMSYFYPSNSGFPEYAVRSATLDEPDCYFCIVTSVVHDPDYFRPTHKSYITFHGKERGERRGGVEGREEWGRRGGREEGRGSGRGRGGWR